MRTSSAVVERAVGDEPAAHLAEQVAHQADGVRVDVEAVVLGEQQADLRGLEQRLELRHDRRGVAGAGARAPRRRRRRARAMRSSSCPGLALSGCVT